MICPMCGDDADKRYHPFCSKRCADVDLAKWMTGAYAVPSESEEDVVAAVEAIEDDVRKPH